MTKSKKPTAIGKAGNTTSSQDFSSKKTTEAFPNLSFRNPLLFYHDALQFHYAKIKAAISKGRQR